MVYFIYSPDDPDSLVKIGYTGGSIEQRLAALQAACPIRLRLIGACEGTYQDETRLHNRFARERRHGEWFYPSERLRQFVQSVLCPDLDQMLRSAIGSPSSVREYSQMLGWSEVEVRDGLTELLAT